MELYTENYVLKDDEYLLKINATDNINYGDIGFLTKLNKNGTIPVNFQEWPRYAEPSLPTYIFKEEYRSGWKIDSWRFGMSQNWAKMVHPEGFVVEIYLHTLLDIIKTHTIVSGIIDGEFRWEKNQLIEK